MDRWALSEAHRLVIGVTEALENFDTQRTGTLIAAYVDDLSNWYVRRSRRRFWDGDPAALATLHECLYVVTLLLAPLAPFITERVWQDMFRSTSEELPESVHLAAWPRVDGALVDDGLSAGVALARRLVELGRAARADAKVRTRQPLRRALVPDERLDPAGRGAAQRGRRGAERRTASSRWRRRATWWTTRPRATSGRSAGGSASRLRPWPPPSPRRTPPASRPRSQADGRATVEVDGEAVEVLPDEVIVSERPREGWSVVNEQGETVALDLELTPELVRAGLAREVVRLVQEARKTSGFEVSDRITLVWQADGELAEALREHADSVATEVLATEVREGAPDGDVRRDEDLGLSFSVTRA